MLCVRTVSENKLTHTLHVSGFDAKTNIDGHEAFSNSIRCVDSDLTIEDSYFPFKQSSD